MHKKKDVNVVKETDMLQSYGKNYWVIWVCGFLLVITSLLIGNASYFLTHPFKLVFFSLLSSIPFCGLALYARSVSRNPTLTSYRMNIKFSGIIGAFALTSIYGIWTFSSSIQDSLDPAGFFIFLALGTVFIGYIVGGFIYVGISKICKTNTVANK